MRCEVCWLPAESSPCSARCRGLKATKAKVLKDRQAIEQNVLAEIAKIGEGKTHCPGEMAEKIARQQGLEMTARDALTCLREVYFDLREAKKLRFFQKGKVVPRGKDDFKGPFRLAR